VVKKKKYDIISKYGNNVSRDAYFLRNSSTNKEQSRPSGDRCMSRKKEENEKQSLKPTPPLGYEVKFSQEGRVKIKRPFPRTPVNPIFDLCMTFLGEELVVKAPPLGSSDSRGRSLSRESRSEMMYEACRVRMLPWSQVRVFQKRTKRDVRRH
jgi:hypothetical protein